MARQIIGRLILLECRPSLTVSYSAGLLCTMLAHHPYLGERVYVRGYEGEFFVASIEEVEFTVNLVPVVGTFPLPDSVPFADLIEPENSRVG